MRGKLVNSAIVLQVRAPIPSKKNNRVVLKNGVNIPSREFRAWHRANISGLKRRAFEHGAFTCPVSIAVGIGLKNRIRRDLDNALTSVLDLLKDSGIIEDDDWNHVRRVSCEVAGIGEDFAVVSIIPLAKSMH